MKQDIMQARQRAYIQLMKRPLWECVLLFPIDILERFIDWCSDLFPR